jgi:hypothetical protein
MNATPTTLATTLFFTCEGDNGTCGIFHRSLSTARRCCARHNERSSDQREVVRGSGVFVTASVAQTGVHFACYGVLKATNGRTVWVGENKPYGCDGNARAEAEAEAARRGWRIRR